jgi:hypothetical protein
MNAKLVCQTVGVAQLSICQKAFLLVCELKILDLVILVFLRQISVTKAFLSKTAFLSQPL